MWFATYNARWGKLPLKYVANLFRFTVITITLVSVDRGEISEMFDGLVMESEEAGLQINAAKMKVISKTTGAKIWMEKENLKMVDKYTYVGQIMSFKKQNGQRNRNDYTSLKRLLLSGICFNATWIYHLDQDTGGLYLANTDLQGPDLIHYQSSYKEVGVCMKGDGKEHVGNQKEWESKIIRGKTYDQKIKDKICGASGKDGYTALVKKSLMEGQTIN